MDTKIKNLLAAFAALHEDGVQSVGVTDCGDIGGLAISLHAKSDDDMHRLAKLFGKSCNERVYRGRRWIGFDVIVGDHIVSVMGEHTDAPVVTAVEQAVAS